MKFKAWVLFGLLLFGLLLGGCTCPGASGLPKVGVAINTWPGLGPYFVAHSKGFDKEEGVEIDTKIIEDTTARNSALASGEVDLVGITLDNVIIAQSNGLPMVVVGESDFSSGGDGIIAKKTITKVGELKGKRVACPEGLPSHFFLLYLLKKEGLSGRDITLVPADDGGQAAALFTGQKVDAAVTWDPWISKAESLTDGHVVITTKQTPRLILGIVAANKNFLAERADRMTKAQRAWFKAVEFCKANPAEANAIMAKEYNVPPEEFGRMLAGAALADLAETKKTFGTTSAPGPAYQLAKDASQLWLDAGVIKKPVSPETAIDRTVIDRLITSGN
jgi:NitT/TauT family transport system substrate-binding protein